MKKLSNILYKKSNLLLALLSTGVCFSFLFLVMVEQAKGFEVSNGKLFLGLSFGFTHDMILEFFNARNTEMLHAYKNFLSVTDIIYPIFYGVQYVIWTSYLYKPFSHQAKWLNLFTFTPAIIDFLENFQLMKLTNQYLDNGYLSESCVQLASAYSISKWILSIIVLLILAVGVILKAIHCVNHTKKAFTN